MAKVDPDNRNADLDEGLGGRMFSGIVTGAQDSYRAEQARKAAQAQAAAASADDRQ